MDFTPELLCAALEKYVFKTKFSEADREYILKQSKNNTYFNPEKTLEHLIVNSEGRLDIYAPAGELWKNLKDLVAFPNNADFLGIAAKRVNVADSYWIYCDRSNLKFLLKSDVPLYLYENLKPLQDEISNHLLIAYTDKLYKLKNTLEYIPEYIFQDMLNAAAETVRNWDLNHAHQITESRYNFVNYTPEEVFWTISKFFDKNDSEMLAELWELLKITAQKIPVQFNLEYYRDLLIRCAHVQEFMQSASRQYNHLFAPKKLYKNVPHFPVIRVFEHNTKMYVFVKDLEIALIHCGNVKIEVETEEERRNGIIRTMEYHEFQQTLWQAGITENDIHMISHTFPKTKHGVNTPILTSYGTHCKLAEDAFCEVFRIFSLDINWFNTVSEKNYYKLIDWFNSISDVFSDTRVGLYLIDVWKIEELKNQIYEQMQRYTRKPKYVPPNVVRFMTKKDMYEEIMKFGSNLKMNDEPWKELCLDRHKDKNMSKWDILVMYDNYCLFQLTCESRKITKFLVNHSNRYVFNCDYSMFRNRQRSLICVISAKNGKEVKQVPKFYNKLNTHRVGFLNQYTYSMSTITSECYYENDTCLKLALDKTIGDESVKSKMIALVYEAEMKKFGNQRRSVFYLTESEFLNFSKTMQQRFHEVMEQNAFTPVIDSNWQNLFTDEEKLREIRKIWKSQFPISQYSKNYHDAVLEILKKEENVEELIFVGLKARKIFEECSEKIRSFKDYCKENKERRIVMRIMCETRIDCFEEWHMFSDEVLEAIEIVLEDEGRLDTMKEKIEKWRTSWNYGENFSTITVKLFKTILNVVEIDHSKFLFMPDVQFFKNYIDLPLKMGYNAMKILSPDGREVYHQVQAQFLIFQYGACDVLWDSDNKKAKDKHKKKVLGEISKIGKGYTLAKPVEQSVRRVMYSDVAQKTALSAFHGKCHDEPLVDDELQILEECFPNRANRKNRFDALMGKAVFMLTTLHRFTGDYEDTEIKKNISKACTMSFGFIYLENMERFDDWYSSVVYFDEYAQETLIEVILSAKLKNESARNSYNFKELIQHHYLFDESDPSETWAKAIKGRNRSNQVLKLKEKKEEADVKLMNLFTKFITSISEEFVESTEDLCWKMFEDYIEKEFDVEEAIILCKTLRTGPVNESMKKKLREHFGGEKSEAMKKVKVKKEEAPKVVVKYVTETKTVESCVNCRSNEKETMDFRKKIENFEKKIEEYQKTIRQNEEDLAISKSQISQNKLNYREDIQKSKENAEVLEAKIKQLKQEIGGFREDAKLEREALIAENQEKERIAAESVRRMKVELENSKFLENAKDRKLGELTAENNKLKTLLEIAEENLKEAENRVNILKLENEEAIFRLQSSSSEEDLYSNPEIRKDFNESLQTDVYGILIKISEVSDKYGVPKPELVKFQEKYDKYIQILDKERKLKNGRGSKVPDSNSRGIRAKV